MATITEDYVSFEIAKLLKEKGFDEGCSFVVNTISKGVMPVSWPTTNSDIEDEKASLIALPTLQMAMKWLREVYKLHIITIPYAPIDRHPTYHPGEADIVYIAQLFKGIIPKYEVGRSIIKLTHEEACEAAIKYCLENLI